MSEDIWAEFDDWNEEAFQNTTDGDRGKIRKRNVELLLNCNLWETRVKAFEAALRTLINEKERNGKRDEYCIHFEGHSFGFGSLEISIFEGYRFPCSTSFKSVNFQTNTVSFEGAKFLYGDIDFSFVKFCNPATRNAKISFQNTSFGAGDVSFDHAVFGGGEVNFEEASFGDGKVSFSDAKLGDGKVSFENARFGKGIVNFYRTKFGEGHVFLIEIETSGAVQFNAMDMTAKGSFHFDVSSLSSADFRGMNVGEATYFRNCTFKLCVDFRGAEFGRPPDVGGLKIPPPEMVRKNISVFKTCFDVEDAAKYRKLNAMAKAANDHDKELEFFAYEMMAKRGHEITGFWELLANSFYYHVSYYGQSWTRPLVGVFISWFVFTFIYLNSVAMILKAGSLNFSAIYSALNSFPFLSSLHRLTLKPQDYEGSLEKTLDTLAKHDGVVDTILNWAMFQQFIGIVLLFFLLLGLRNRFRLK